MPERLLITGGCGFIGANLISHLRNTSDYDIRVLDDQSLGSVDTIAPFDIEFIDGDIRNRETVDAALAGVDAVVHLAADTRVMDSIENPVHNYDVNCNGTFNLLSAAVDAGTRRFVAASTGGAILGEVDPPVHEEMAPKPTSPYGASKLMAEGYMSAFSESYGLATAALRFSNVYGPLSIHKGSVVAQFFRQIIAGEELVVYGDGSQQRDYVFVEDLAEGIRQAVESDKSGAFQLGTGIATDINELIASMRDVVGTDREINVRYEDFRAGEIRNTYCDVSKARAELGYDPTTSLAEGLVPTWKWFTDQ